MWSNSIYPSPYNFTTSLTGIRNHSHISTVSIGYVPGTLPTPWPWLVLSLGISFITTSVSALTNYLSAWQISRGKKASGDPPGRVASSLMVCSIAINTIRAISSLVASIRDKKAAYPNAHHLSPSGLVGMLVSMLPYTWGNRGVWWMPPARRLMVVNFCVGLLSLLLEGRIAQQKSRFYGEWFVHGGVCPQFTSSCNAALAKGLVGCGSSSPRVGNSVDLTNTRRNSISQAELAMFWVGLFTMLIFYIMQCTERFDTHEIMQAAEGVARPLNLFVGFLARDTKLTKSDKRWNGKVNIITLVVLAIVAAIALPVHVCGETKPQALFAVDGIGVVQMGSYSYVGSVWADCFSVPVPVDRLGFLQTWWNEHEQNMAALLAFA